jgi:heterodisulfide reductase subunit A-like polyferredoxin
MLGLDLDVLGRLQSNNIRLLPELSNRAGIFLAGACRGATYVPDAVKDARNAALSAHELLLHPIETELSHAVVDGEKCALCLTCVRVCPFRAMAVNAEKKQAECVPESCRKCGTCAGECPNKAIALPLWSDRIVLARAGAVMEEPAPLKSASRAAGKPAKGKEKRP